MKSHLKNFRTGETQCCVLKIRGLEKSEMRSKATGKTSQVVQVHVWPVLAARARGVEGFKLLERFGKVF